MKILQIVEESPSLDFSMPLFEFIDEDYEKESRDSIYYVRAIQEASPVINAGNLRCTYNQEGECVKVNICYGDSRTDKDDDCLTLSEERAWSSPIYVNYM